MPREKPRTLSSATSVSPTCSRTSSIPAVGAPGPRRPASAARFSAGGQRGVETGAVDKAGDTVGSRERPPDRRAQDLETAAVGDGQAQQQAEQCRLPRAVRPGHPVDLPLRHIEIDTVEGDDIAEALGDPAEPGLPGLSP